MRRTGRFQPQVDFLATRFAALNGMDAHLKLFTMPYTPLQAGDPMHKRQFLSAAAVAGALPVGACTTSTWPRSRAGGKPGENHPFSEFHAPWRRRNGIG